MVSIDYNNITIETPLEPGIAKLVEYQYTIPRIAKFYKVSYEQFKKDLIENIGNIFDESLIQEIYNDIKLPVRGTKGSAGYDFFAPFSFKPTSENGIKIPTGIKCKMAPGWTMKIYPRSGQGNRHGVQLYDTTAIIDEDYFNTDNEGHIMIKINSKEKDCEVIPKGVGFCQGVFTIFGITEDDDVTTVRTGGFGSTTQM